MAEIPTRQVEEELRSDMEVEVDITEGNGMPNFTITTKRNGEKSDCENHRFRNEKAATDDAQVALSEMARDALPNGSHVELDAKVENEAGDLVYRASLNFRAQTGKEIKASEKHADEAADDVAAALRGGRRE